MTEADWNSCTDPQAMIAWLHEQEKLTDRKARLVAVAVCRRIWPLLTDERSRRAVAAAERYADEVGGADEVKAATAAAANVVWERDAVSDEEGSDAEYHAAFAAWECSVGTDAAACARQAAIAVAWEAAGTDYGPEAGLDAERAERAVQATLLCDLVNAFRTAAFDPSWRTPDAVSLACQAFDRFPDGTLLARLASTLEAAGCRDAELLGHLRSEGPHVRGCHAVDLVLGNL